MGQPMPGSVDRGVLSCGGSLCDGGNRLQLMITKGERDPGSDPFAEMGSDVRLERMSNQMDPAGMR